MASAIKAEVLVVAGVALAVIYLTTKAASKVGDVASQVWDTAVDATKYVNPTSSDNLAYQGASSLARWLTGQETGDLGTIAWDYVHKGEPDPVTGQPLNYSAAQQAADLKAIQQLEAGYHGM
jgi:hypothetical protein